MVNSLLIIIKPVDKPIDDLFGFLDAEPNELTGSTAPSSNDTVIRVNHYLDEPSIARTKQNILMHSKNRRYDILEKNSVQTSGYSRIISVF